MKKSGLLIIAIVVIILVVAATATYAFYSASRDIFTFYVGSASGESISLVLDSTSTGLRPATTTVNPKSYTKSASDARFQMAKYVINYENGASDPVSLVFYITDVEYITSNGDSFSSADQTYLNSILDFALITNAANDVSYNEGDLTWIKSQAEYDSSSANKSSTINVGVDENNK